MIQQPENTTTILQSRKSPKGTTVFLQYRDTYFQGFIKSSLAEKIIKGDKLEVTKEVEDAMFQSSPIAPYSFIKSFMIWA